MYTPIIHNGTPTDQLPIYDNLTVTRELMGSDEISVEVSVPDPLNAPIGSHIVHRSKDYTINTVPSPTKISNYEYRYAMTFESDLYRLYDKKLKHLGNQVFQYYGSPTDYAQLIVNNINSIDSGWMVGDCEDMPEMPINFTGQSCRAALDTIAEAFKIEWSVEGKEIRFVKQVGNVTSLVFEYGRGKGLYSLGYQYNNDKNIVTRAFGYGSTRNLPEGYRDGATQLMFDGLSIDANTDIYGIKEGDYVNEEIYPEIDGTVIAVSAFEPDAAIFTITDSSLDFNLNDYFSELDAKVSFKSGELQGQEFVIKKYDHGTKTITLKVFEDGNSNRLPSASFQVAIGDRYTLFDMHLPDEVVADAEARLLDATTTWLEENCIPRVLYSLEIDPLYARDNGIYLNPGDQVRIIDDALGIDAMIRVTKTTYPFVFPERLPVDMKIVVEIANFIPYTKVERIISDTIDTKRDVKVVDRINLQRARQNAINMKSLSGRLFDPDGNLAKGTESLYAAMATFGFDSQNFSLIDVTIAANAGADPNSLVISAGKLAHYFYEVEGLGYEWIMSPHGWSGLDPAKFYYVYAKCSKTALVGTWEISETPVFANDIPGYWAFNLGQLFEVNTDGYRDFEFTKGMTYIVGDQITTGRIKSMDGVNYFDLSSGTFNLGGLLSGLDWGVTEDGKLTVRGEVVATGANFIDLFVQNLSTSTPGNKRAVLDALANNFRLYNASDQVLVEIDDDNAREPGEYYGTIEIIPKPKNYLYKKIVGGEERWYYYNVGPGITVGINPADANGFSSMSRTGVSTNGTIQAQNPDSTEKTEISTEGLMTTGSISFDGELHTKDSGGTDKQGITKNIQYMRQVGGSLEFWWLEVVNGIIVSDNSGVIP